MRGAKTTRLLLVMFMLCLTGAPALCTMACGAPASPGTTAVPAALAALMTATAEAKGTETGDGPWQFVAVLEGGMVGYHQCGHPLLQPSNEPMELDSPDFCSRATGQEGHYTVHASDPRASGTLELTELEWFLYPDGHTVFQGRWVLANDGGTWVCEQIAGVHDTDDNLYVFIEAFGTGTYEGLVLCEQWHFTCDAAVIQSPSGGFAVSGWIEETR